MHHASVSLVRPARRRSQNSLARKALHVCSHVCQQLKLPNHVVSKPIVDCPVVLMDVEQIPSAHCADSPPAFTKWVPLYCAQGYPTFINPCQSGLPQLLQIQQCVGQAIIESIRQTRHLVWITASARGIRPGRRIVTDSHSIAPSILFTRSICMRASHHGLLKPRRAPLPTHQIACFSLQCWLVQLSSQASVFHGAHAEVSSAAHMLKVKTTKWQKIRAQSVEIPPCLSHHKRPDRGAGSSIVV